MSREDSPETQAFLLGLGRRVRALRSEAQLSRRELSEHSGVSLRFLAQLEAGEGNVSVLKLRAVAIALEVEITELLDSDPVPRRLVHGWRSAGSQVRAEVESLLVQPTSGGIALVGLRGAGKTSLGRALAECCQVPFLELNTEIAEESGLSVSEIFSLYGEEGFRELERACLERVTTSEASFVLATPGGVAERSETFELLLQRCFTIWVRARPEEHMKRVRAQGDHRPMRGHPRAMDDLRRILERRSRIYGRAHVELDTSGARFEDSLLALRQLTRDRLAASSAQAS